MPALDELIVGLDIGSTQIHVVLAEKSNTGHVKIVGVASGSSRGLRRGVVVNIEAVVRSLATVIEQTEQIAGRTVYEVYAAISGGSIEGLNSRGVVAITNKNNEITPQDVEKVLETAKAIVMPPDRAILHVLPQEFIVDDQTGIKDPVDMMGIRLEAEVHIITCAESVTQNITRCINRSGYKVNEILLGPLAAGRAILSKEEKSLGVLLIDMGGATTDALVYLEGAPHYTGTVPLGGSQVTNDLAIMLNTSFEAAEQAKLQVGCCWNPLVEGQREAVIPGVGGRSSLAVSDARICQILQPRVSEILAMVRNQIERSGYTKKLSSGVVVTGGAALLPGMVELTRDIFEGIPTRIGCSGSFDGYFQEETQRGVPYSTAMGLVSYAAANSVGREGEVEEGSFAAGRESMPLAMVWEWMKKVF